MNARKLFFLVWLIAMSIGLTSCSIYESFLERSSVTFVTYTDETIERIRVGYNDTITVDDISRVGYTFGGWYVDDQFQVRFDPSRPISSDTTLYAYWIANTYQVSFVIDGQPSVYEMTFDTPIDLTNVKKTGHHLTGLYTDQPLTERFTDTVVPAYDLTLYTAWARTTYQVSYLLPDGTVLKTSDVLYQDPLDLEGVPREGYGFNAWYLDADLTQQVQSEIMGAGDLTLYGSYAPLPYDITFHPMGGDSIEDMTFLYLEELILPTAYKPGYLFIGWSLDPSGETPFEGTVMPFSDLTLYAIYEPTKYILTYHLNNGLDPISYEVGYEVLLTVPEDPIKIGHTFAGWYLEPELIVPSDHETMPGYDLNLYAKWTRNTYTLTYVIDPHPSMPSESILYDDPLGIEPLTLEGYQFMGWYDDLLHTTPYEMTTMPAHDVTIYAWFVALEFHLTYHFENGTANLTDLYAYDETIVLPPDPSFEGHTFTGWYVDPLLQEPMTMVSMPDRDLDLYAGWDINMYTLSYVTDPHPEMGDEGILYGTPLDIDALDLFGYTFEGWYLDASYETLFDLETMPAMHLALYAKWTPDQFELSLMLEERYQDIQTGLNFSMLLSLEGELYASGENSNGQLGTGDVTRRVTFTDITSNFNLMTGETITDVGTGLRHTIVLSSTGRVFTFGNNTYGQLGSGYQSSTPIDITSSFPLLEGETVIDVDAGHYHSVVLTSHGRVFSFGLNFNHELGDNTSITSVSPVLTHLPEALDITAIEAHAHTTSAITNDQTIYVWGKNDMGQLALGHSNPVTVPANLTEQWAPLVPIKYVGGLNHSLVLIDDHILFGVGSNSDGELALGQAVTLTPIVNLMDRLGLLTGETILDVFAGNKSTAVLTSDQRLLVFGDNNEGQLGNGTKTDIYTPFDLSSAIELGAFESWHSVRLSTSHLCLLTDLGRAHGVGENADGRLGDSESALVHEILVYDVFFQSLVDFESSLRIYEISHDLLTFSGWYEDEDLSMVLSHTTMPYHDLMLWGRYLKP